MSITLTLTDDQDTVSYNELTIKDNLNISQVSGKSTTTTLSGNVYTDFVFKKHEWTFTWDYMTATDYDKLVGFYNRQFSLNAYPTATITTPTSTITTPVAMEINDQVITNQCGMVEDIEIVLRETIQL